MSDLDEQMNWTWVNTGYVDPRMDAETKAACLRVENEMHQEDQAYQRLARHLIDDHGVPLWGGLEFNQRGIEAQHAKFHAAGADHEHDEVMR